jgi:hypothetical protein
MRCAILLLLATIFLPSAGTTRATAQEKQPDSFKRLSPLPYFHPARFKELKFPSDLKAAFEERLKMAAERESMGRRIDEFLKYAHDLKTNDPTTPPNAEKIKSLWALAEPIINNPDVQRLIKDADPELFKKLQNEFKNFGLPEKDPLSPDPNSETKTTPDPLPPLDPFDAPGTDEMTKWVKDFAEELEGSRFGNFLITSPGYQEFMADLRFGGQGNPARLPFNGMGLELGDRVRDLWRPEWSWRPKLGNLPRPDLHGWRPHFSLPGLGLPGFTGPSLGPPSFSGGPVGSFRFMIWVFLAVGAAGLLWLWRRHGKRLPVARRPAPVEWPIAPDRIVTRAQLIHAFDYLSQLLLGKEAVYWNHRRIAEHLAVQDDQRGQAAAAWRLANVYETVRYTEGPETLAADLSEQQRDAVRRDLCLLAAPGIG